MYANSPCGFGRSEFSCQLPSVGARDGPYNGARRATIPFIGCSPIRSMPERMSLVAPLPARFEGGREVVTHGIARRREEWEVLIRNHHDGYISWEEYDRNQKVIAGNANMKGAMVRGPVRHGGGLLVGLLRCGHCGRKLKVQHHARRVLVMSAIPKWTTQQQKLHRVQQYFFFFFLYINYQLIADRERAGAERLRQSKLALEQSCSRRSSALRRKPIATVVFSSPRAAFRRSASWERCRNIESSSSLNVPFKPNNNRSLTSRGS